MTIPPMSSDTRGAETYKSAADCPLGAAHGMASTHHNAADEWACDFCGFPVEPKCTDCLDTGVTLQTERSCSCATPTSNIKDNPDD